MSETVVKGFRTGNIGSGRYIEVSEAPYVCMCGWTEIGGHDKYCPYPCNSMDEKVCERWRRVREERVKRARWYARLPKPWIR